MATLQVKGIDEQLYKALGARASTNGRSISFGRHRVDGVETVEECRPCND